MIRLSLVVWAVAGPTLAGILILLVLTVPALSAHDMKMILPAAGLGAVLAIPISYIIAKHLLRLTAPKA